MESINQIRGPLPFFVPLKVKIDHRSIARSQINCFAIRLYICRLQYRKHFPQLIVELSRLYNVIQDPISRHYITLAVEENREVLLRPLFLIFPLESFFDLNFRFKDFQSFFLQNSQNRIKRHNRIRNFNSFVDEAAPGFELGKKDLQSPALPLGHAAKTIHNRRKNSPPPFFYQTLVYLFSLLYLHIASIF